MTTSENDLKTEGFILEVEKGRLLVAENITEVKYQEIKNKTIQELDEARISLIYLSYNHENNVKAGNKVTVWIDGGVEHSYPAQAGVKKIAV